MIMEKCTGLSLEYFQSSEMYDNIQKITGEISYRPFQIFLAVISLLTSVITMVSSAVLLFSCNLYINSSFNCSSCICIYFLKIGQQEFDVIWNRAKDERKTWYSSYLLTHDFSYKEVSLLGIKDYLLGNFMKISNGFIEQNIKILKKKTRFNIIYEFIMQFVSCLIIGGAVVISVCRGYFGRKCDELCKKRRIEVQSNLQAIMANIYTIYNSSLYMDMLFEFLNYCGNNKKSINKKKLNGQISSVNIKNLSFSYKNKKSVLKHINISLQKGRKSCFSRTKWFRKKHLD